MLPTVLLHFQTKVLNTCAHACMLFAPAPPAPHGASPRGPGRSAPCGPTCSLSTLLLSSSARLRSSSSCRRLSSSSSRLFSSCSRLRCSRSCCLLASRSLLCCYGSKATQSADSAATARHAGWSADQLRGEAKRESSWSPPAPATYLHTAPPLTHTSLLGSIPVRAGFHVLSVIPRSSLKHSSEGTGNAVSFSITNRVTPGPSVRRKRREMNTGEQK